MKTIDNQFTVFVLTVGDDRNFTECLSALDSQTLPVKPRIIRNIAPLSVALQSMIDQCQTPYYVQVDEDMILYKSAIQVLVEAMHAAPPNVAVVCAPLWDCYMSMPIHGVKIYNHSIVRLFPYHNTYSSEWTQVCELRSHGYALDLVPLKRELCLGEHGKHFTPKSIYIRYQRLVQKNRRFHHMPWLSRWASKLSRRVFREDVHDLDISAIFGLIAGLTSPLADDAEWDFRDDVSEIDILHTFFSLKHTGSAIVGNDTAAQPKARSRVSGRKGQT